MKEGRPRTYTQVMVGIAEVAERLGTDKTTIPLGEWSGIIRELAELPEPQYREALRTLEVLHRVAAVRPSNARTAVSDDSPASTGPASEPDPRSE